MDPLTKPEWRAGVNQVLSPMWRVGEGDPSGLVAPIGATYRQTDANATYGSLTGLLWNKVGTGTALGTDWLVDFEGRWISYTPTVTAGTGSFTTVSGAGSYTVVGKMVHLRPTVTITTNGTAAGAVVVTLPSGLNASTSPVQVGHGRADGMSGKAVTVKTESATTLSIRNYDNSYPGSSGEVLRCFITYEIA